MKHRRHLMSAIYTDIDPPEGESPTSPPFGLENLHKLHEEDHQEYIDHLDNAPPQPPIYDYTCNWPLWCQTIDIVDEKSKQQFESKQVYNTMYGQNILKVLQVQFIQY